MQEENQETATASGSGLAAGAVFLLAVAAIGYYAYHRYHRQKTAQVEANQRQPTWDDATAAAVANYDAIDVETHETNKEDQDTFERNVEVDVELEVQKPPPAPLSDMPSAYPGGQSLPPWPYPEARPTPASYDPACILKRVVAARRRAADGGHAARDVPGARARAQRRPRQRQCRDGGVQGRRRRARRRGRLRRAVADRARQAPAAAADQPPPPPPKTGEV